ncbi:hypothetical protein [Litchfieldia salsa]|uniref:Uncharacterized protein n=1 Tax=Litchfieldia salsa TaxID=930152 RepID=A0A1H0PK40_9BACI|nr:hypothetical protein [Litchfieldia salsa]SDP05461.1 hypothetical protein SAMN05216565_101356 [Litchfieldia salsa]
MTGIAIAIIFSMVFMIGIPIALFFTIKYLLRYNAKLRKRD